jgi:hypothetical protein
MNQHRYTQLEFEIVAAIGSPEGFLKKVQARRRKGLNPLEYSVKLSNALRWKQLTHAVYDVLACVAAFQASGDGFATYPRVVRALGCTFENVRIHVSRNPELFQVAEALKGEPVRRLTLTGEAVGLLRAIKGRIDKTGESC